ncbi:uncharacterized protein [Procambarus clarkii]|uniref:uncharacterized protein n=1 Tax=Procambarus clarkii TaxID=6728 RepID=UPI00374451C2
MDASPSGGAMDVDSKSQRGKRLLENESADAAPERDAKRMSSPSEDLSLVVPRSSFVVVLIQSESGQCVFANPRTLGAAIEASVLWPHCLPETIRTLGRGAALKLHIRKETLSHICVSDIIKLGDWPVRCRQVLSQEESRARYGKIGPIDQSVDVDDIQAALQVLGGASARLLEVTKIRGAAGPTSMVRVKFDGHLPDRVALHRISYQVQPYNFPVLRCYACHLLGHSRLTCRNAARCANCGKTGHSDRDNGGCSAAPRCFLCHGHHKVTSKSCPVYLEALQLDIDHKTAGTPRHELFQKLRTLNQPIASRLQVPPSRVSSQVGTSRRSCLSQSHASYAQVANRFSLLGSLDTDGNSSTDTDMDAQSRPEPSTRHPPASPQRSQHRRRRHTHRSGGTAPTDSPDDPLVPQALSQGIVTPGEHEAQSEAPTSRRRRQESSRADHRFRQAERSIDQHPLDWKSLIPHILLTLYLGFMFFF